MTPFPRMPDAIMSALDIVVRPTATAALSAHVTFLYNKSPENKRSSLMHAQMQMTLASLKCHAHSCPSWDKIFSKLHITPPHHYVTVIIMKAVS